MKYEKTDKYDYLIALATLDVNDADVTTFLEMDDSDVVLSDRITKKIENLIRRESKHRVFSWKQILSKAAIVMLIMISVTFTAMLSVSAIRNAIWEIVTEWYEEYIAVGYEPGDGSEAVEPPKTIEEIRKPTLLPLGAEEEIVGRTRNMFACEYYLGDDCYVTFHQHLLTDEAGKLDGENVEMKEISVGDHSAYLFIYGQNDHTINWTDGEYVYSIMSDFLSLDELISIAESVK